MIVRIKQSVSDGVIYPAEILMEGTVPEVYNYIKENWIDQLHMLEVTANLDEDSDYRVPEFWKTHHRISIGRLAPKNIAPSAWRPVLGSQEFIIDKVF